MSRMVMHLAAALDALVDRCGSARSWCDGALDDWIGLALPPARRALEEREWTPDPPDAYCRRCGASVGPGEATATGCAACRDRAPICDEITRLGPYSDELRSWILQVKFRRWFEMAEVLGRALGRGIRESSAVEVERAIVTPAPMPWPRRAYRGIDHACAIAEGVARELGCPVVPMLRRSVGPPQVSLPASRRRRAGGAGMRLRRRWRRELLRGVHVVLVDDVLTTGGTLRAAAARVRTRRPSRLVAAVLAVTDERGRRGGRRSATEAAGAR